MWIWYIKSKASTLFKEKNHKILENIKTKKIEDNEEKEKEKRSQVQVFLINISKENNKTNIYP